MEGSTIERGAVNRPRSAGIEESVNRRNSSDPIAVAVERVHSTRGARDYYGSPRVRSGEGRREPRVRAAAGRVFRGAKKRPAAMRSADVLPTLTMAELMGDPPLSERSTRRSEDLTDDRQSDALVDLSTRSLFTGGSKQDKAYQEAFLHFLLSFPSECSETIPVMQMLMEISEIESCNDSEQRLRKARSCLNTFAEVFGELGSGNIAMYGVYAMANKEFARELHLINRELGSGEPSDQIFDPVKQMAYSHLDKLYFCRVGVRVDFQFVRSPDYEELHSKKEVVRGRILKDKADRGRLQSLLYAIPPVTVCKEDTEDRDLCRAIDARLCLNWSTGSPLLRQKTYRNLKAKQVLEAYLAQEPTFHAALSRIVEARRGLLHAIEKEGSGKHSRPALKSFDRLLTIPKTGLPQPQEFIRHLNSLEQKQRAVIEGLLGEDLLRSLKYAASSANCKRLKRRIKRTISVSVRYSAASYYMNPKRSAKKRKSSREQDFQSSLKFVTEAAWCHGDPVAARSLEFLAAVREYWHRPSTHAAKRIIDQYLAVGQETVSDAPCVSGLYQLFDADFEKKVRNVADALKQAAEPQANLFEELYARVYESLCSDWLSPKRPVVLPEVDYEGSHEGAQLSGRAGSKGRSKSNKAAEEPVAELLSSLDPCASRPIDELVAECVQLYLPVGIEVNGITDLDRFVQAKVDQIVSHMASARRCEFHRLAQCLYQTERMLRHARAVGHTRGQNVDAIVNWIEEVRRQLSKGLAQADLAWAEELYKTISGLHTRKDISKKHRRILRTHLLGSVRLALEMLTASNARKDLREGLEPALRRVIALYCMKETVTTAGEFSDVQVASLKVWQDFLSEEGDIEAIRMTQFLLDIRENTSQDESWSAERQVGIYNEYLNLPSEVSVNGKPLRKGLYFLWRQHDLVASLDHPSLALFGVLQTRVSERLFHDYTPARLCCAQKIYQGRTIVEDLSKKTMKKDDPKQVTAFHRLLEGQYPEPSEWQQRLYKMVLAHFALPGDPQGLDLSDYLAGSATPRHVQRKIKQIVQAIGLHRLGVPKLWSSNLQATLALASDFVQSKTRVAPSVARLYRSLVQCEKTSVLPEDQEISRRLFGVNVVEGWALLRNEEALHQQINQILRDLYKMEVIRRHPTQLTLAPVNRQQLAEIVRHIPLQECTRTYIMHGTVHPSTISIKTHDGTCLWQMNDEQFQQAAVKENRTTEKERIIFFYWKLFSALGEHFYGEEDEEKIDLWLQMFWSATNREVSRSQRPKELETLRESIPWIDALVAGTNDTWRSVHDRLVERYPITFASVWPRRFESTDDKHVGSEFSFIIDHTKETLAVEVNRAHVTISTQEGEGALWKFRVMMRMVFEKGGGLNEAFVVVSDHQLGNYWLDFNHVSKLIDEHYSGG